MSPIKTSKKKHEYYNFKLQTSPSKFKECVAFNTRLHQEIQHYETTGTPAKLLNVNEKPDTLFVNEISTIVKVPSSDVTFERASDKKRNQETSSLSNAISKAGLTKDAKSDEVAEGLLLLEDIKLQIDKRSKVILKVIETGNTTLGITVTEDETKNTETPMSESGPTKDTKFD